MSSISFIKYQGTGNDFILIDDRAGYFPKKNRALIQTMCHRQFGVGADGLILLTLEQKAHFGMRIFNRDGCEAESCGNGLRCLLKFLQELGIVRKINRIKTQKRIVVGFFDRGLSVIEMGKPKKVHLRISTDWGVVHFVDTGVPHVVQFVPDVDAIDIQSVGAFLRKDLHTNVDFASLQNNGSIRVRTYERGVEGETLSCGTGAAAVACIASLIFDLKGRFQVHFRGGNVEVWEQEGKFFLAGPAEKVFTGSYPFPIIAGEKMENLYENRNS